MAFVVAATWRAKRGRGDRVAEILAQMIEPSRRESGCLGYWAHRSVDDDETFFLYEVYKDRQSYNAHTGTAHFKRHVLGEAAEVLDARERSFYVRMED